MENTDRKETADKVLTALFYNITLYQDIVSVLRNALAGNGFSAINEETNLDVWFYPQFKPRPLPEDPDEEPIRDAFLPDTVVIDTGGYASQGLTGEDRFTYAYSCDEFCDRLQDHLDQHYYPDHRQMRDIVDPLVDQLRAEMPDPGMLPDTATLDDKIWFILDRWLSEVTVYWLYKGSYYRSFSQRMAGIARGDEPHTGYFAPPCFPWTPDNPQWATRPSDPGTVLLTAGGKTSRLMHEGEHFETVISGDQFCDLVQAWLDTNWYPGHRDEQAGVEASIAQLRAALQPGPS